MSLAADRTARFFTPAGREIDAGARRSGRGQSRRPPPVDDPDINLCGWDGESVDYDAAVDAMCVASGAVA